MESRLKGKRKEITTTSKKRHVDGRQFCLHSSPEDAIRDCSPNKQLMTDFDLMMILKRKNNIYHRTGSDIDVAKRNDDHILELLETMQQAADQDRQLNRANKPATKKIALLKHFLSQLIKKDLQLPLLEHNVLNVLADWISPLPSKALPCLQIREGILKMLGEFPTIEKSYLKQSGIGKAVMYLYKHPDETNANRKRAGELIHGWFRTIYNVNTELKTMSREERQQLEMKQMPANKRKTMDSLPSAGSDQLDEALWLDKGVRGTGHPGDRDWVGRARVPMPSDKAYVVRPKSKIDVDICTASKKQLNRYEKHLKMFNDQKRKSTMRPLVNLSNGSRNLGG